MDFLPILIAATIDTFLLIVVVTQYKPDSSRFDTSEIIKSYRGTK